MEIMEAASAEISYQQRVCRDRTGNATPRADSKAREYCDDLQELVRMLVNAHISENVREGFIDDLRPLMIAIFRQVRLNGNVEEVFKSEVEFARAARGGR